VILKECSSYFPGNSEAQRATFQGWEEKLSAAGAKVVLATVVPVTSKRSTLDAGKQEALTAFNAWVREFAARKNLAVLDLDAAVRSGAPGSSLKDEYTSGDGSHLNQAAYAVPLDARLQTGLDLERPYDVAPPAALGAALPGVVSHPVLRATASRRVKLNAIKVLARKRFVVVPHVKRVRMLQGSVLAQLPWLQMLEAHFEVASFGVVKRPVVLAHAHRLSKVLGHKLDCLLIRLSQ